MKLIPLIILVTTLAVDTIGHELFTFPPQFHGSHTEQFSSDKQFYLPPESHTVVPYFPVKNLNNLPFPYLPSTATKAPNVISSPFPSTAVSSTMRQSSNEDDEDKPTPIPSYLRNRQNRTQRNILHESDRRQMRPMLNRFHHAIDRIDTKLPIHASPESQTQISGMHSMTPRSIVVSDMQREQNFDQIKSASYPGAHFGSQPGIYISTTEIAVPILRLSNEMDLDGSFSYEALGADQTHYVQHSRMEQMGPDKQEQVVEGSYSYVGDDGKTYTVHYVADSNGFRASGDHLPVPPPVPEIIQRSVQYNLAEEIKKPPHLRTWNEENEENNQYQSENQKHFTISQPHLGNLFTGKAPESFSRSFSQGSNTQNNLVTASTTQRPFQIINFGDHMQNNPNSGKISPQITFVASQGAQDPGNTPQPQQNMNNLFTTERPVMPLIVNYEANNQDWDQESNKQLWRWQYGLNANSNMNKNLISRSSGANDISISFNDMTADQYTKMLQQQFDSNINQMSKAPQAFKSSVDNDQSYSQNNHYSDPRDTYDAHDNYANTFKSISVPETTESTTSTTESSNNNHSKFINDRTKKYQISVDKTARHKIITKDQFFPPSQTVTQSYNYDSIDFEPRRTRMQNNNVNAKGVLLNVVPLSVETPTSSITEPQTINTPKQHIPKTQEALNVKPITKFKFTDFVIPEDNDSGFKPIFTATETHPPELTSTTEISIENIEENIFLKNLFKNEKSDQGNLFQITNENKNLQVRPITGTKIEHHVSPKHMYFPTNPFNEMNTQKPKSLDMADLVNYLARNHFESARMKSKPKQFHSHKEHHEMPDFIADDSRQIQEHNSTRNLRTLQQQEELRGAIKNYKVLRRNNNIMNSEHSETEGLYRNLSPSTMKVVNLPPLGRAGPSMKSYLPPVYIEN